jgi:C4-dicarboxylate-specific signal transduction histidine kinase
MRNRIAGVSDPLRELKLVPEGRRVRIELDGQRFEAISGQLLFDFDPAQLKRLLSFPTASKPAERRVQRETADAWFQKGLELEQTGAPTEEIVKAYEMAVSLDAASAGAWLNLGTIHFNARGFVQAERYYKKALEAELMIADRMAALGRLAAAVGHEINNPLAYVVGHLELARADVVALGSVAASIAERLAVIEDGIDRVRSIVADLRNFASVHPSALGVVDPALAIERALATASHETRLRASISPSLRRRSDSRCCSRIRPWADRLRGFVEERDSTHSR